MPAFPKIDTVIIDALDPDGLARFWSAVLGRPVASRTGPYVWLQRVAGLSVRVPAGQHDEVDQEPAPSGSGHSRPQSRAASRRGIGRRYLPTYAAGGFLVMPDPEGNEFCLIPDVPLDVDDRGRAAYLDE